MPKVQHFHPSGPGSYVLVTAAYNEEANLQRTIDSVAAQTSRPGQWVIVDDGSTDGTPRIVAGAVAQHGFIKGLRVEKVAGHCYGAKARALNRGIESIPVGGWRFIGVLDADLGFEARYFESVLGKFQEDPRLGIAGGLVVEEQKGQVTPQDISQETSVAGGVQLFRRECFERLGSFRELPHGGEDSLMEIAARYHGWRVRTIPELKVLHFGYVGRGSGSLLKAKYRRGLSFYHLGYHPLFQFVRCLAHLASRPWIVGSVVEWWAFMGSYLRRERRFLDPVVIEFLRREQIRRLLGRNSGGAGERA